MASVAAFCQKHFCRIFFSKNFDHFCQNIGAINLLKKIQVFFCFFFNTTQVVVGNSFFSFGFFRNRVRQKPKEVGPSRSSTQLKPSVNFSCSLSIFYSNSGVCHTFHLHSSSLLFQRKKDSGAICMRP